MDDFEESITRISTQIGYELILREKNLTYTKITYSKKRNELEEYAILTTD